VTRRPGPSTRPTSLRTEHGQNTKNAEAVRASTTARAEANMLPREF
jgi:hypothetical protein